MSTEDDTERLADYRAGRLSAKEQAAFADRLAEDGDAAAWDRIAEGIHQAEASEETSPGAFGWARLSRSIDAERPATPNTGLRLPLWQVAAALVIGIGLWQIVVVPRMSDAPGYSTTSGAEDAIVRVMFVETATEAEIRALMRTSGAVIVDGPSAIGLYSVSPRQGESAEQLAKTLAENPAIVRSATLP